MEILRGEVEWFAALNSTGHDKLVNTFWYEIASPASRDTMNSITTGEKTGSFTLTVSYTQKNLTSDIILVSMGTVKEFLLSDRQTVVYPANYYKTITTNARCDTRVEDTGELEHDLKSVGFTSFKYWIRPSGSSNLVQENRIFVTALKPQQHPTNRSV